MAKYAVLVIDMMKNLVYGYPVFEDRFVKIIDPINRVLDAAHAHGIPVIFSNISFRKVAGGYDDGGILNMLDIQNEQLGIPGKIPRAALEMGAEGLEIIDELHVVDGDYILRKNRYSAFYGGDLETLLKELGVDTLIVVGIVTNICVRATCLDAFQKGWNTIVPRECVQTYSDRAQEQGLEDLMFTTSELVSVNDLVERIADTTV
ncbi:MAG: cysteine hydrolase [Alicyclobacillus macrosporangiidus]|uniref:isochorismatase family cysteine hydrolase n=1 Tax=Alicyclobacillus macrosporangiidus TaxID=392015 RepID=UPI0026EEAA12|nr:isochorismatase family cysteine hydrolase [Alicyclobacillus macrosporangiidus]MCL6600421.1 cysteine hydrolase [Alicyclobacillus macrosporangiidus]